MERYSIYTGRNLSKKKYLTTWELDNQTFKEKDKISKQMALDWFEWSRRSTIVLWDNEEDSLVGYISPFLLNHDFSREYILSDKVFYEALKEEVFVKELGDIKADIYLFSAAIVPKYRDKTLKIKDKNSPFYNKKTFQILNEALVDWICDIKRKGVSVNYVYSEKVSRDGEKYLKSLGMQPCLVMKDDCKYSRLFTPVMFSKCDNMEKLINLYSLETCRKPFDEDVLKGHEYLSIKDGVLHYKDLNLLELVEKYKAPLEVAYTPMITQKVQSLKKLFAEKIKKYEYPSKYNYAYATKANYYSEVVLTALNDIDMLETSSAYDIEIIFKLAKEGYIKKGFTVLCNGFKNEKYVATLKNLLNMGINVIPIIENEKELKLIGKLSRYKISVGLRYNSDFESRLIKNTFDHDEEFDNRFGFDKEEIFEVARKIQSMSNLTLKVFHFHFGGSITSIKNYLKGFTNLFSTYCEMKKQFPSLEYFDFGGGFPVKYSLVYSFDYERLVDGMVKAAKNVCKKNNVECPQLIGEHGRFTAADHSFYIYKIDFTKKTNNKNWYIINGSLMNMAPDIWGIEQDFTILPVNLYNNPCIPVCLGGETCDPDDRYFLNDDNVKIFMPTINEGETLYIAIFSIGAYQEIISGIGGLHHCLLPEGNELIIFKEDGKYKFVEAEKVTETEKIYDVLDYDDRKYMRNFYKKKK